MTPKKSHRSPFFLTVLLAAALLAPGTAQAQWYRVDKKAKKAWRDIRKFEKGASRLFNTNDINTITKVVDEGLAVAEEGVAGLNDIVDMSEATMDAALKEANKLLEDYVEDAVEDIEDYAETAAEAMTCLYTHHAVDVQNMIIALQEVAASNASTASVNKAANLLVILRQSSCLEDLIDRTDYGYSPTVESFGYMSPLGEDVVPQVPPSGNSLRTYESYTHSAPSEFDFRTLTVGLAVTGGGFFGSAGGTVGMAIYLGSNAQAGAFFSFGAGVSTDYGPNAQAAFQLGLSSEIPADGYGPGFFGEFGFSIPTPPPPLPPGSGAAAAISVSLPKIIGQTSFPFYKIEPPELTGFRASAVVGAGGFPASLTMGGEFTAVVKIAGGSTSLLAGTEAPDSKALFGSDDNNRSLSGSDGVDYIYGLGGKDYITGWGGNDLLEGGDGNDRLIGSEGGADVMHGDAGDDTLEAFTEQDIAYCGDGNDYLIVHHKKKNIKILAWDYNDGFGCQWRVEQKDNGRKYYIRMDDCETLYFKDNETVSLAEPVCN